jgi:glycosyltransferase involved in cell wall biosynthesis/2-polyprenyl-3-methyl-5-hydroxy-6-metoxy-1,4-benzoquinol methylase
MEIAICSQGLPFGPNTLDIRSLGGSETAALNMAKELRKRGHLVTIFCNIPREGQLDHIANGGMDEDGVRYVSVDQFKAFVSNTELDLIIVSRNPDMFMTPHQAKKAVLWCHDLATYENFLPRMMNASWNFDEVWTVSEFHRQQMHKVTGYPLDKIRATRNGITRIEGLLPVVKLEKTLLYSARPERGLDFLVKQGGIMERLPDYKLFVTMYDNFPEQLRPYYEYLWERCKALPNVTFLGPKSQKELRQIMAQCTAYVYPTAFEEVSCIIARECIEQKLPIIYTDVGALRETIGLSGNMIRWERNDIGSPEFCQYYAERVMDFHENEGFQAELQAEMAARTDLYWDEVAAQWEEWAKPRDRSIYSMARSMVKDGDVIPAFHLLTAQPTLDAGSEFVLADIKKHYPYLMGDVSFEDYYNDGIYEHESNKGVPERQFMHTLKGTPRYQEIAKAVAESGGEHILEYGCAEGPIILQLAADFPEKHFVGIDFVKSNIALCEKFAKENNIHNVEFYHGSTDAWPLADDIVFDAAIIAEVLEHTECPWLVTDALEQHVKVGGKLILTVPQGPWEWGGLQAFVKEQWSWRAHIWHINKWMLRKMYETKKECTLSNLVTMIGTDGRSMGHLVMSYTVDREPATTINPLEKAYQSRPRHSVAACMISMNDEDVILRCLNSISQDIDILQIALGPSTDKTQFLVDEWARNHPWVDLRWVHVPKVENGKFGFDDARNASIQNIEADWILWIDTDEYLSGQGIQVYLRDNAFDSYALFQHHFTCEPRGNPTNMDKPARLFRTGKGFQFFGKVHEHAELGFNGGPGFVMVLPNIDIGHVGYVNETVRRKRFERNFPLLKWDRDVYPDRRLGKYLWMRDLIHLMKLRHEQGHIQEARRLAEEAVTFYKNYAGDFDSVGGGPAGNSALAYFSDAVMYLGRGHSVKVALEFNGQQAVYEGYFEDATQALQLATRALGEQFDKRNSGYWA